MRTMLRPQGAHRWMSVLGSILRATGSCLLILVVAIYAYGRFEAWAERQPRALTSSKIVWSEVPPLGSLSLPTMTPLPATVPIATVTPLPAPIPTEGPTPGPPVLIRIDKLGVKRAIVPVGQVKRRGKLEWDTDRLFATSNRRDLVGHLQNTANPGEPGNIVLTGHNYNRGAYNWVGVFNRIGRLRKGDIIVLVNETDERFRYEVAQVEKVPLKNTLQHVGKLGPTRDETLTLATCGGANLAPFPSRLYVTAKRLPSER